MRSVGRPAARGKAGTAAFSWRSVAPAAARGPARDVEFAAPRLTSVHIPSHEVTLAGLNWLLNRCYDMALPVARQFEISVTWRASVAAPPTRKRS